MRFYELIAKSTTCNHFALIDVKNLGYKKHIALKIKNNFKHFYNTFVFLEHFINNCYCEIITICNFTI